MAQKVEKETRRTKRELRVAQVDISAAVLNELLAIRLMMDRSVAEDGPLDKILRAVRAIELETAHPPRVMTPATDRELTAGSFDLTAARELLASLDFILRGSTIDSDVYTLNANESRIVLLALRRLIFSTGEG